MDLREISLNQPTRHPWEIVRGDFIIQEIIRQNPNRVIDIGSGDGYLGKRIENETGIKVLYIDAYYSEEDLAKPNHYSNIVNIEPLKGDLLLLADVLEHVENPSDFIGQIYNHYLKDAKILITVPAFEFLFSDHDKFLGHFRRYNQRLLLEHTGKFVVFSKMRYFFFVPLIIRTLQVLCGKKNYSKSVSSWKFSQSDPVTLLLNKILHLDILMSWLPGLSLLAVGRLKK